jgi:hypothetical protein
VSPTPVRSAGPEIDHRVMLGLASRPSDSPYVERVWRSEALGGPMTSVAASHREIVFWRDAGAVRVAVRGPETVPSELEVPPGHTTFGIVLAHGATMPTLPASALVDSATEVRHVTSRGAVIGGEEVPLPQLDTGVDTGSEAAEGFVHRLVGRGLVVRDPLVDDVLDGGSTGLGRRTVERRVRAATGLSPGEVGRIERVRQAAILLGEGTAPLEVVGRLGYHDHPHLARALTRYVGRTASRLRAPDSALSLLYKVDDLPCP